MVASKLIVKTRPNSGEVLLLMIVCVYKGLKTTLVRCLCVFVNVTIRDQALDGQEIPKVYDGTVEEYRRSSADRTKVAVRSHNQMWTLSGQSLDVVELISKKNH